VNVPDPTPREIAFRLLAARNAEGGSFDVSMPVDQAAETINELLQIAAALIRAYADEHDISTDDVLRKIERLMDDFGADV
jgi:hypothetical protein